MAAKKESEKDTETVSLEKVNIEVDPINQPENASDTVEPQKRKRGRPKGSTNKNADGTSKPSKSNSRRESDVADFARQLQGIHTMIAMISGFPEMQISDQESLMLSRGISAVAVEYGLSLDGKTGAAIQLLGAASLIYIPRAIMIKTKIDKNRAQDIDVTFPDVDHGATA